MKHRITFGFLFIAVLLISACGRPIPPNWAVPYIELFNKEASLRGVEVNAFDAEFVIVEKLEGPDAVIGRCYYTDVKIAVEEEFWKYASDTAREILIFHELGHCILKKGHSTSGIMRPRLLNANHYRRNRTRFLDELFFKPRYLYIWTSGII